MDSLVVDKLNQLNRQFYQDFARHFSDTRRRLQPGVHTILHQLPGDINALDLGCGNGVLACALVCSGRTGRYLGMDFSAELITVAREQVAACSHDEDVLQTSWLQADLAAEPWLDSVPARNYSQVFAFATLHHIPGNATRRRLLSTIRGLMVEGGCLYLSNWQFMNSERLRARIQPWETINLSPDQLDSGDHLLDWRRGGHGLRYVHHFNQPELDALAQDTEFKVVETFLSDGENGRLGLYNTWIAES